ncbi:MAG: hypothetical protein AAF492_25370, partial [Verrucomicrobiota bacterium]
AIFSSVLSSNDIHAIATGSKSPADFVSKDFDLRIEQTVNRTNLLSGTNLTYTLVVTNYGTATASGVRIINTLPGGVQFQSASYPATLTNVNEVVFSLGLLGPGAHTSIVLQVTVSSGLPASMTNWAEVASSDPEHILSNNRASVETVLPDTDGDGLANPADPDDDNDFFSDLEESIADTDPLDASSYLWVEVERTTTQGVFRLTFPTSANRQYFIQSSSNLFHGWTTVISSMSGSGGFMACPVMSDEDSRYFRVGVESP